MSKILVSYNFEQAHRKILQEVLSGRAGIKFLSDIAEGDRAGVIAQADLIIAWNPAKEFSPEELRLAVRAQLIQLVTAGAEHLPFALLPPGAIIASNTGAFAAPMAEHILAMVLALCKAALRKPRQTKTG